MCLTTKQTQPLVAERDILVYKVLEKSNESPFFQFQYVPNKRYDIGEIHSQPHPYHKVLAKLDISDEVGHF